MNREPVWSLPPDELALSENEIHIWRNPLDRDGFTIKKYGKILSQEEFARAVRFHFERDKRRFVMSRVGLRMVLGWYLGLSPDQIRFHYGEYGKPSLGNEHKGGLIQFNMAHSSELAICAFVRNISVGVDIEKIRTLPDADQIAERFFSAAEYSDYQTVFDAQKSLAFFNCWTRKEAFIKAIGEGLSYPLHKFEVTLIPDDSAELREIYDDPQEAANWEIRSFIPAQGYLGAVAIREQGLKVRFFESEADV
jgi:4'-phosphopantetheinyl transferase